MHNGRNVQDGTPRAPGGDAHVGSSAELLTPGEVARLFGVDPKTVTRWAAAGKLTAQRTLGGHRRYDAREVHALLERANERSPR